MSEFTHPRNLQQKCVSLWLVCILLISPDPELQRLKDQVQLLQRSWRVLRTRHHPMTRGQYHQSLSKMKLQRQ